MEKLIDVNFLISYVIQCRLFCVKHTGQILSSDVVAMLIVEETIYVVKDI